MNAYSKMNHVKEYSFALLFRKQPLLSIIFSSFMVVLLMSYLLDQNLDADITVIELTKIDKLVSSTSSCQRMHYCFNYSRCSLASGFSVYLYDSEEFFSAWQTPIYLKTIVRQTGNRRNSHFTKDPRSACLYLVLTGEQNQIMNASQLQSLLYWNGNGENHLILNLCTKTTRNGRVRLPPSTKTGKAIVAQSAWKVDEFRVGYDLIVPPLLGLAEGYTWTEPPFMLPPRRKYLLSFQGFVPSYDDKEDVPKSYDLKLMMNSTRANNPNDFHMEFECDGESMAGEAVIHEWQLCNNEMERANVLKESTFALIPPMIDDAFVSTPAFLVRLCEALKYGAIPVIVGSDNVDLPYSEVIDWQKATLSIPLAYVAECDWLLRKIPDNDLLLMRRQGRLLYDKYFSTGEAVLDTILAVIRNRLAMPPPSVVDESWPSAYSNSSPPVAEEVIPLTEDNGAAPLQIPFDSLKYRRNFSIIRTQNYEMWNVWGDPFHLYPYLPFDPVLPSDAKFNGSDMDLRLSTVMGGVGKKFRNHLGGNGPEEEFTVLVSTYKREQLLLKMLKSFHGIPFLNKIIILWNNPLPPSPELRWPNISAPIHVILAKRNSMNNRFLPFDAIETEAVVSLDDDTIVSHEELLFGFRMWRQERDRLIGYEVRYHDYDLKDRTWKYHVGDTCEFSLVLGNGMFLHKYYFYAFSYYLPQKIHEIIDEYINCEDIAMNFLVAHMSRKPPIKVSPKQGFTVSGISGISTTKAHYQKRDWCINLFSKVFGYTPLLMSQFRADTNLYNAGRAPENRCYKSV